jgi:hypothetical protein
MRTGHRETSIAEFYRQSGRHIFNTTGTISLARPDSADRASIAKILARAGRVVKQPWETQKSGHPTEERQKKTADELGFISR